jgi:hypothetical protein
MKRRIRTFTAWLALAALVFAQLATAAYACPQLTEPTVVASAPDCHGHTPAPNLCERHCDYGKASFEKPKPIATPDVVPVFVRVTEIALRFEPPRADPHARIATGPPPTRFTVLRI